MKLAVCSDLHLEFGTIVLDNTESADVLILAGDICIASDFTYPSNKVSLYHSFFDQVSRAFPKVIYILGNHEHYHGDFALSYNILKEHLAVYTNIMVMDKESVEVGDITFVCATMWTSMNDGDPITLNVVKDIMGDFKFINNSNKDSVKFTPEDSVVEHKKSIEYVDNVVGDESKGYVVVTHHTPSWQSCAPKWKGDPILNGAFHTELGDYMAYHPQIKVWIHGHTHEGFDYVIGSTRVVCNPRGYFGYEVGADTFKLQFIEV